MKIEAERGEAADDRAGKIKNGVRCNGIMKSTTYVSSKKCLNLDETKQPEETVGLGTIPEG